MKIPILMYHSIEKNSDVLSIDLKNFEKQMKYMKSNNFKTISFDDLNKEFKDEKNFIITFDDGYENVYYNALPILKKYNFTATCFFVSGYIGKYNKWDEHKENFKKKNLMNINQIEDWYKNGMSVGSHTFSHKNLRNISLNEKHKEILDSYKYLSEEKSFEIKSFSYPYGSYDLESENCVKKIYKFAVTTKRSRYMKERFSNHLIPRVPVNKKDSMFKFYMKINTIYEDIKFK